MGQHMDVEMDKQRERLIPTESHTLHRTGDAVPGVGGGRRAQVINATMSLIAREGVAALSTRKIAREVPINLATLHDRFGGKDDLLLAVLEAATSAMIGAIVADVHPGGGIRATLEESFAALSALLDRAPALPLVRCEVLLYAGRRPALAAGAFQHQQRLLDALESSFREACVPGALSSIGSGELAGVLSSSIDGLALQLVAGVPRPQQEATRAQVLRALLALVGASTSR